MTQPNRMTRPNGMTRPDRAWRRRVRGRAAAWLIVATIVLIATMSPAPAGPPVPTTPRGAAPAAFPTFHHYLILGGWRRTHGHGHAPPPVSMTDVARRPYAYGWFGAPARRHWSRHEGYRGHYVQWHTR